MTQIIKKKELIQSRMLHSYGSWMYCDCCNETIGYLCYITYHNFFMEYNCKCGNKGSILLELDHIHTNPSFSKKHLITVKNRLCCPQDESPLVTILENKLSSYSYEITCKQCEHTYKGEGK